MRIKIKDSYKILEVHQWKMNTLQPGQVDTLRKLTTTDGSNFRNARGDDHEEFHISHREDDELFIEYNSIFLDPYYMY